MKIDISVIIPSYNCLHYIFDCLESVFAQETEYSYEVIVVDSSEEDITPLLIEKFPDVIAVHSEKRAYPGTARNIGLKHVRGEVIAFTDTDCVVAPNWLQSIMESQKTGRAVVGGAVGNGTPWNPVGTSEFLLEFNNFLGNKQVRKVKLLPTCNLSYKKELFDIYGGFEDTIKGSDSIFSRKMNQNGIDVYLDPAIKMYHRNRKALKKFFKNQYDLGIGSALTRRKMDISGSFLVRYPFLIPLIPVFRTSAISLRLIRWSPLNFLKFIVLYPLLFSGLMAFTAGFIKGVTLKITD